MKPVPDFTEPALLETYENERDKAFHFTRGIVDADFDNLLTMNLKYLLFILVGGGLTGIVTFVILWSVIGSDFGSTSFTLPSSGTAVILLVPMAIWVGVFLFCCGIFFVCCTEAARTMKYAFDILLGSSLGVGRSVNHYVSMRILVATFSFAIPLLGYYLIPLAPRSLAVVVMGFYTVTTGTLLAFGTLVVVSIQTELQRSVFTLNFESIPRVQPRSSTAITISHWSDIHLTASEGQPLVEDRLFRRGRWSTSNTAFSHVLKANRESGADVIILTGDLTDSGSREEWEAFRHFVDENPYLLQKLILVPGNHDINIVHQATRFKAECGERVYLKLRLIRFILAVEMIQGDRAYVITDKGRKRLLSELVRPFAHFFEAFIRDPPRVSYTERIDPPYGRVEYSPNPMSDDERQISSAPYECWNQIFPMVIPLPTKKVAIIVCNSVKMQSTMAENALGEIDSAQLIRLKKVRKLFSDYAFIYALHHHIKLPPEVSRGSLLQKQWSTIEGKMMALANGDEFLLALPQDRRCAVMHGHRHYEYEGCLNEKALVFSARSTTLGGQTSSYPPGHRTYRFGIEGNSIALIESSLYKIGEGTIGT